MKRERKGANKLRRPTLEAFVGVLVALVFSPFFLLPKRGFSSARLALYLWGESTPLRSIFIRSIGCCFLAATLFTPMQPFRRRLTICGLLMEPMVQGPRLGCN
jgi:hypothetical protein